MRFDELYVGQEYRMSKSFSRSDVIAFSKISLDDNPIHIDEQIAEKSIFKKNIVHGFLTGSLFSAIIGTKMPGPGSIYLSQNMNFLKPVFWDQKIEAVVKITEIKNAKRIVFLKTECYNDIGELVIEGTAVIKKID